MVWDLGFSATGITARFWGAEDEHWVLGPSGLWLRLWAC